MFLVGFSAAGACGTDGDDDATPAAPTTVVVAVDREPASFNVNLPGQATPAAQNIVTTMWPSAYRLRPDFTAEPWLLSSPATIVSTDPFTVEWRIRPDVNWSDGVPVSADDFEFLYRHCAGLVPGAQCDEAAGYDQITAFEKVDAKTVRVTFDPPYVEYESLFRNIPPSHVAEERAGGWNEAFSDDPGPSAGPFRFESRTRGDRIVLERNDRYFGDLPSIERLVFRVLEPPSQADALRNGEVDLIFPTPTAALVATVDAIESAEMQLGLGAEIEHLSFNLENEFLAMAPVRRAIALAINREAIVDALVTPTNPDARRLDHRVFLLDQQHYEAHGEEFAGPDLDRARAELEAAGFERGEEGFYRLDGRPLELSISTTSGHVRREQQLQLIEAQLVELGIQVTIENAPDDAFAAALAAGDFDLASFAGRGSAFPLSRVQAIYGSGGGLNHNGFSEPRVDELLAQAAGEADPATRAALLNELDVALWDFLPDLPLYQPPTLLAYDGLLDGVQANLTAQGHLWNVEAWSVLTEPAG